MSLFEAAARCSDCPELSRRAVNALAEFVALIGELSLNSTGTITGLVQELLERTGYGEEWRGSAAEQDLQRLANVDELVTAAQQYDNRDDEEPTLEGFLEQTALVSDVDSLDEDASRVTLMTLHAAKGLEFPVVYIVGVEQNLIPHERAVRDGDYKEIEEERRLLFVGITRAMERLVLTQTLRRDIRGQSLHTIPSEFLTEISVRMIDRSEDDAIWNRLLERPADDLVSHEETASETRESAIPQAVKVVTGAELMNGAREAAPLPVGFAVGMTVRHPQYGNGTVVQIGGFSKHRTVTVLFDDDRRQTWVAHKCPLQPVGLS